MLTFANFLLYEEIIPMHASLGLSRDEMPQVLTADVKDFIGWLKKKNISVERVVKNAKDLSPSQHQLDADKVRNMVNKDDDGGPPILTSSDDYVVDGHHRYMSRALGDKTIECYRINMPARELIKMMGEYPRVKYRPIHRE
jgi:hypothetical protein